MSNAPQAEKIPDQPLFSTLQLRAAREWARSFPRRTWQMLGDLWRYDKLRLGAIVLALILAGAALRLLDSGGTSLSVIVATLALGLLVLGASWDHRTIGSVIVACLSLSLIGSLAGPHWAPVPLSQAMTPTTPNTQIGGLVSTTLVGTYVVNKQSIAIPLPDGDTLDATLRLPQGGPQARPGVVFMHGAGTHTPEGFAEQAEAMASAGIVTLVPDKPHSNYGLTARDYPSMAEQYRYAFDHLRGVSSVDPGRVGLYAESEGGYPGVVLAGSDPDVAFLVLASAPVLPIRQQATYAAGTYLRNVGVPDPLLTAVARLLGARELPGGFTYADFDGRPYEEKIRVPILMIYGTADSSMPLIEGPERIAASIAHNGNEDLTVRYYADANHGLKFGTETDGPLAPGVTRDLSRWVLGLPETANALPHVAGEQPIQDFSATAPGPTRWYASGDLIFVSLLVAWVLVLVPALALGLAQLPRLARRRAWLILPQPLPRWLPALLLSLLATWILYGTYIARVAELAMSYSSNRLISYGGWWLAQAAAVLTVTIFVRICGRMIIKYQRQDEEIVEVLRERPILSARLLVLTMLLGVMVQLIQLAYWGLFPILL